MDDARPLYSLTGYGETAYTRRNSKIAKKSTFEKNVSGKMGAELESVRLILFDSSASSKNWKV